MQCLDAIRSVQKKSLEQFAQLLPLAAADSIGKSFVRAGGHASAFEKSIILLEWVFWQNRGLEECGAFLTAGTTPSELYQLVSRFSGSGLADDAVVSSQTYYYQAETQLGKQAFATAHLAGLLHHESTPYDWSPTGTNPTHDPAPMTQIQNWVKTDGARMIFLYGQYDPWTGGAFEIGTQPDVVKVVAPKADHGAMITNLIESDRTLVLKKLEEWIGRRPSLYPAPVPTPPMPMFF
jgi:hypothetical protein